jgi:sterol desaturase/sphingolipid hydroxylase (fatty acid hydroxylase superfamily)
VIQSLTLAFAWIHERLFEILVQPALYSLGLNDYAEMAFEALEVPLIGLIEVAFLCLVFRPLEALRPIEAWPDRREARVDIIYTLLVRLGIVPLGLFLIFTPAQDFVDTLLSDHGLTPLRLEQWLPGLEDRPLLAFLFYLLLFDLSGYVVHRLQHRFDWWWALHSLHHSQRQMSFWADDRNHLLDDVLTQAWLMLTGILIGVEPENYLLIMILAALVQNVAHANVRLPFGWLGERLLVSPRFHRAHHALELPQSGAYQGCNFAVLFPVWDMLFGTANFTLHNAATGIADDSPRGPYRTGFFAQQVDGCLRLWDCLSGRQRQSPAGSSTST